MQTFNLFTGDPSLLTTPKIFAVIIGIIIAAATSGCGIQMGTSQYWDGVTDRYSEINRPGRVELVESPPPNVEREKLYRAQSFGVIPPKQKRRKTLDYYTQSDRRALNSVIGGK